MSESDHDRARELAEAISEGINSLVSVLEAAKTADQPPDGCLDALDAMAQAYEAVRNGRVVTDYVPSENDIARVRRIRELLADWLSTGRSSPDLVPLIGAIFDGMGIEVGAFDSLL